MASALFALVTVLISCRKPGRMAARVSPIEAVRYAEGGAVRHGGKRNAKGVSLLSMAQANLGRNRVKTAVTVLSLSLAVVLLTVTVTFTNGFDMDKYVSNFTASDFIVADAGQFQTGGDAYNSEMDVTEDVISAIDAQGGITDGGLVYGKTSSALEFVTEEYYRSVWSKWNTPEQLDSKVHFMDRNEEGLLADRVQLYGMEQFPLDHLTVLAGDLSKLNEPGGRYVAAVYSDDDYGQPEMDSHWARLGDTVTLRYVEEYEYYNPDTGEIYGPWENVPEGANWVDRAVKYRDIEYEVAALVTVPMALSYRYYGADEFIMNDQTFIQDTGTDSVMYYAFDTTDEANPAMESFLADYTENVNPQFDYESKSTYAAEFEGMRSMFLLLGGGPQRHRWTGGGAELFQCDPHRHHHPKAGVGRPPVHRHDRWTAQADAGMGGAAVRPWFGAPGLGAGPGIGPDCLLRLAEHVLVLHLPLHLSPHPGHGPCIRPVGLSCPSGGIPLSSQAYHRGASAGFRIGNMISFPDRWSWRLE